MPPSRSQSPQASPASRHGVTRKSPEICAHLPIDKERNKSPSPSTTDIAKKVSKKRKRPLTERASGSGGKQPTALCKAKQPRSEPQILEPCGEKGDTMRDSYDIFSYKEIWKSECLLGASRAHTPVVELGEQQRINAFIDQEQLRLPGPRLLEGRLRYALLTTKWWEGVGCQICYVQTGKRRRDHELRGCLLTAYSVRAAAILDWLESLIIPHTLSESSSRCSLCEAAFLECEERKYGGGIARSNARYISKTALGGHCKRRPIVGRVIAALAAYDDQFLGRWFTKYVSHDDSKGMHQEGQARAWFQQQLPLDGNWYPGLLLAFEYLVLAFYHRQNTKRGADPLVNFPTDPPEPLYFTYEI